MDHDGPSRTALAAAYARAYHQSADDPLILIDPLAARLADVTADDPTELDRLASDRPRRLFFAARSRFAEDRVAAAVTAGVGQVVILGAGLDTFAYRNPHPNLRVFEVDHPATQAWKHRRLAASGIEQPEQLTFVPVDFETEALPTALAAAGYSRTDPAVFIWLGVVFYLTADAANATLEYIAGQSGPVEVIFDYLRAADTDDERAQLQARAGRAAAVGEPWFSYFTPDGVATQLHALGFTDVEDHSATDLVAGYLDRTAAFDEPPAALRPVRILRASR